MDEIRQIPDCIHALPIELQKQVLDFVDFIVARHQSNQPLSEETKQFLDRRVQAMKMNPEEQLTWEESRREIRNRLGYQA